MGHNRGTRGGDVRRRGRYAADQDVVGTIPGPLLLEQFGKALGEVVEVLVPSVGDAGGEVGPVGQLERKDGRPVAAAQPLQLGHIPGL
jgi:hypothetical protein